jgi:DNA-directed RNA polymerase subunit E"
MSEDPSKVFGEEGVFEEKETETAPDVAEEVVTPKKPTKAKAAKRPKGKKQDTSSTSSIKLACRRCKYILSEDEKKCPSCGGSDFSDEWNGIVIILDTTSDLAKVIGAKKAGRYAIKVR